MEFQAEVLKVIPENKTGRWYQMRKEEGCDVILIKNPMADKLRIWFISSIFLALISPYTGTFQVPLAVLALLNILVVITLLNTQKKYDASYYVESGVFMAGDKIKINSKITKV